MKQYQNAEDTRGRPVMSCMTPAAEGTFISIDDEEAKQFRESVVEWLMTNHPHDCPVCEEGGNCHLQDMTVMTGHSPIAPSVTVTGIWGRSSLTK